MLFVDGVGLAPASEDNPFATHSTPALEALLGGPLTIESCSPPTSVAGSDVTLVPLDARLGVPGLPQSSTGQASLFTGVNAAQILGRHRTGLPGPRMREVIVEHSLFRRAREADLGVTFANAYSQAYLDDLESGDKKPSATTTAMRSAGIELRDLQDLERGEAVTWDLCGDHYSLRRIGAAVPQRPAREAGRILAEISSDHDLTLFETFFTDLAGHLKRGIEPEEAVRRLDEAIGGLEEHRAADVTWILTSDHGNLEDTSVGTHTTNPVPLLAVGPAAAEFADLSSILDVAPAILRLLGVPN